MTKVPASRTMERIAVNETRALLERHGHIVQEVEGGSDFGEDLYVSFVQKGRRTGDLVAIQVKGGLSFRRASGYAVSTRKHADDWRKSNVPVICVVYDPEMRMLFWANASEQLRIAKADGKPIRSVKIGESDVLADQTLNDFVREARRYLEITDARESAGFKEANRRFSLKIEGIALKDAPVGGYPNRFFLPAALWLERHPTSVAWVAIASLLFLAALALAFMWPTLWHFAAEYAVAETWMWMTVLYGFTILCLCLIVYEKRLGRKPIALRLAAYIPVPSLYYAAIGNRVYGFGLERGTLEGMANSMPGLLKSIMIIGGASYIAKEIVRRRRLRSALSPRNPVSPPS